MTGTIGLLIPFYNHGQFAKRLLDGLLPYQLPVIIIDDGSDTQHRQQLQQAVQAAQAQTPDAHITLIALSNNTGKGGAVIKGLQVAGEAGLTHVIQIDADCQHDFSQLPVFIKACQARPDALICGYPTYDATVPKSRLYPRYITHFWVWVNTLSFAIKDAMCGFRCYPLTPALALCQRIRLGKRMDFDIDIVVRLYWAGLAVINLPVKVVYHDDASSHFRLWADNVLISRCHARLFLGMLWRLPRLLSRHFLSGKDAQ